MSGNSHVGTPSLYQADDQRHSPQSELREAQRNREHPPKSSRRGSSHAKEQRDLRRGSMPTDDELHKIDPLAPAKMHGHKPSKGATIDAELLRDDQERLRQKAGR
ncbi:hypothetical protein VTO42DRAFT_2902 [Malbranchea cinnamomea]